MYWSEDSKYVAVEEWLSTKKFATLKIIHGGFVKNDLIIYIRKLLKNIKCVEVNISKICNWEKLWH
jgi:hypothetical protein